MFYVVAGVVPEQKGQVPETGASRPAEGVEHDERESEFVEYKGGEQRYSEEYPGQYKRHQTGIATLEHLHNAKLKYEQYIKPTFVKWCRYKASKWK